MRTGDHLAVAGGVFNGVFFFVLSFFPLDVLDEIWDLIESVSEEFLTYSLSLNSLLAYVKKVTFCNLCR